jgi:hypothetical protein
MTRSSQHEVEGIDVIPREEQVMSRSGIRLGAAVLTSAVALGASGAIAGAATPAATPQSLSGIQTKAAAAVSLRVDDLNAAVSKVNADQRLGSDNAALVAYLQADIAPLQALGQKIAGDTIESTAAADYATVFTNFRVLALVLPAAHIAGTADQIGATTVPKLTALATKAASHVDPSNQAVLQPLINDLNAQIAAATNATAGVSAMVLAYTPAQWNANRDLLASGRGSVQSADTAITKAHADLKQIAADLKPAGTAQVATPTTAS